MPSAIQVAPPNNSFLEREMGGSSIALETAAKCGVYVESDNKKNAAMLGWKNARTLGDCLVFPRFDRHGKPTGDIFQIKPSNPLEPKRKYESPKGRSTVAYFPPIADFCTPGLLVITEGAKKTLAGNQDDVTTIGLSGVWNWGTPRPKNDQGKKTGPKELCDDLRSIGQVKGFVGQP